MKRFIILFLFIWIALAGNAQTDYDAINIVIKWQSALQRLMSSHNNVDVYADVEIELEKMTSFKSEAKEFLVPDLLGDCYSKISLLVFVRKIYKSQNIDFSYKIIDNYNIASADYSSTVKYHNAVAVDNFVDNKLIPLSFIINENNKICSINIRN